MSQGGLLLANLAGTDDETGFGRVEVVGNTQLGGASVQVSLADGFVPAIGDAFPVLSSAGTISGAPASAKLQRCRRAWRGNSMWVRHLVELSVVAGLSGDYNGNGIVDAADYTIWHDTLGQTGTAWPRMATTTT